MESTGWTAMKGGAPGPGTTIEMESVQNPAATACTSVPEARTRTEGGRPGSELMLARARPPLLAMSFPSSPPLDPIERAPSSAASAPSGGGIG